MDDARLAFAQKRLDEIFAARIPKCPETDRAAVRGARETDPGQRTPEHVAILKKYVDANVGTSEGLLELFDPPANKKRKEMQALAEAHRQTKGAVHHGGHRSQQHRP